MEFYGTGGWGKLSLLVVAWRRNHQKHCGLGVVDVWLTAGSAAVVVAVVAAVVAAAVVDGVADGVADEAEVADEVASAAVVVAVAADGQMHM